MTWIFVSIVLAGAMLAAFGARVYRDLRNRRELREAIKRRTPTRPVNEAERGQRCHRCGELPVFEDDLSYLGKCDDGESRCRRCRR